MRRAVSNGRHRDGEPGFPLSNPRSNQWRPLASPDHHLFLRSSRGTSAHIASRAPSAAARWSISSSVAAPSTTERAHHATAADVAVHGGRIAVAAFSTWTRRCTGFVPVKTDYVAQRTGGLCTSSCW